MTALQKAGMVTTPAIHAHLESRPATDHGHEIGDVVTAEMTPGTGVTLAIATAGDIGIGVAAESEKGRETETEIEIEIGGDLHAVKAIPSHLLM